MRDLTILYYTANRIDQRFAARIRERLDAVIDDAPVVSISREPLEFGENIVTGPFPHLYGIYKSILIGALIADTPYVATAEDDTIYTAQHFRHRPPNRETFAYNRERWQVDPDRFFYRRRQVPSMGLLIAPTALLIEVLCSRISHDPLAPSTAVFWGEPGRAPEQPGGRTYPVEMFWDAGPQLMFNHRDSTGGRRRPWAHDVVCEELPGVGRASTLWTALHA